MTLFHVTLRVPTRDDGPHAQARRERRIYPVFGRAAAWRKYRQLSTRWPYCVDPPEPQGADARSPIL